MTSEISIVTFSHEETGLLGELLGELVPDRTVLTLDGDLGSGKTTFAQGIAKGLGISEQIYITSPTYTLVNEYVGRCRFFHVDLYRMTNPSELDELGLEEIISGEGVVAIEWSDRLTQGYLTDCLSIRIDITDDDIRKITLSSCRHENENLIKRIDQKLKEKKWH